MTLRVQEIIATTAHRAGLSADDLVGRISARVVAHARQRAYWAIHRLKPHLSTTQIARYFDGRDHTTIIHGLAEVEKRRVADTFERVEGDELLRELAPDGPPVMRLSTRDIQLVSAAVAGREVAGAAVHAMVDFRVAEARLTLIMEQCARALGRAVVLPDLHSGCRDALVDRTPTVVTVMAEPILALPAPESTPQVQDPEPEIQPLPERAIPAPKAPVKRAPWTSQSAAPPVAHTRQARFSGLAKLGGKEPLPEQPARPSISAADRALIDAAIAAGRVQVLDAGQAAGLTQIETLLYAARPPLPEGGWKKLRDIKRVESIKARARQNAAVA